MSFVPFGPSGLCWSGGCKRRQVNFDSASLTTKSRNEMCCEQIAKLLWWPWHSYLREVVLQHYQADIQLVHPRYGNDVLRLYQIHFREWMHHINKRVDLFLTCGDMLDDTRARHSTKVKGMKDSAISIYFWSNILYSSLNCKGECYAQKQFFDCAICQSEILRSNSSPPKILIEYYSKPESQRYTRSRNRDSIMFRGSRDREYFLLSMAGWLSSRDISWQDKLIDARQNIRWKWIWIRNVQQQIWQFFLHGFSQINVQQQIWQFFLHGFSQIVLADTEWKCEAANEIKRSYQHQLLTSNMQDDTSWLIYDLINEIFNHWIANALIASTISSKIWSSIESMFFDQVWSSEGASLLCNMLMLVAIVVRVTRPIHSYQKLRRVQFCAQYCTASTASAQHVQVRELI